MKIQHFYDQETATFTYIASDEKNSKKFQNFYCPHCNLTCAPVASATQKANRHFT